MLFHMINTKKHRLTVQTVFFFLSFFFFAFEKYKCINPFTAPARKLSRLKDAHTHLKIVYFPVLGISTFNAMRFDENFRMQVQKKKKTRRLKVLNLALLLLVLK